MGAAGIVVAVVIGISMLSVLSRVLGRSAFRAGLAEVGRQALARQFDHVHLAARNSFAWQDASAAAEQSDPLLQAGFQDAGVFSVDEIPGVVLRLMSKPDEGLTAIAYEHPRVGHWLEIVTRYTDGTSASVTNSKSPAMDPRPGHPRTRMPGAPAVQVLARARHDRPEGPHLECPASALVSQFETAYAEEMAWRKQRGVSPEAVARVIEARGRKVA